MHAHLLDFLRTQREEQIENVTHLRRVFAHMLQDFTVDGKRIVGFCLLLGLALRVRDEPLAKELVNLARFYGFGQVFIHACCKADLAVLEHGVRGHRYDMVAGHARVLCFTLTNQARCLVAIHHRHLAVHEDDVIWRLRVDEFKCCLAVLGDINPAEAEFAEQLIEQQLVHGVLLGLQLWISVEALMLIAIIYCWYGVGWLRGHAGKALSLAWLSTATAITALIALLVERPSTAWLTPVYDSISIAQVYALMVSAMFAWALHILPTRTLRGRFTLAILGSALVLFVMALTYPKLLHGPMVEVDPYIFTDFLPQISEAKPFYAISPFMLTAMLLVPLVGLGLCMLSLWRKRLACYDAAYAETLAFFLAATLLLYLAQQRWSYYLLPLAIVSVAPLLGAMFTPEHPSVRGRWPR
jgi:hypothetical protein